MQTNIHAHTEAVTHRYSHAYAHKWKDTRTQTDTHMHYVYNEFEMSSYRVQRKHLATVKDSHFHKYFWSHLDLRKVASGQADYEDIRTIASVHFL